MQRRTLLANMAATGLVTGLGMNHALGGNEPPAQLLVRHRNGTQTTLTFDDLRKLAQHDLSTPTPWYPERVTFRGPLLRDVLKLADFKGKLIVATAINDYQVSIPVEDAMRYDVVVAHSINSQRLNVRTRGPLFVIYPFESNKELRTSTYYARCIWQLTRIEEA